MEKNKIILGLTSSIAVYRTLDLIRIMQQENSEVQTIMTSNACKLVNPIMFQAFTNKAVYHDTFDIRRVGINHISLAEWGDILVICPATANIIGKLSSGVADDLLSTLCLAFAGPKLIVPAMNSNMWENSIVQKNCQKLQKNGYDFVGPISGRLATGKIGIGHIAPIELIWKRIKVHIEETPMLTGHRFLVAGGRTEEPLDPIRIITNRASGRMALAISKAIMARNGQLHMITGPTNVEIPDWIPTTRIHTSVELKTEIESRIKNCDCLIMTTAVCDYRATSSEKKIKSDRLNIELLRSLDVLKNVEKNKNLYTVGFSLDTEDHIRIAKQKLVEKGIDIIVANTMQSLSSKKARAWIIDASNVKDIGEIDKDKLANIILDRYLSWSKNS